MRDVFYKKLAGIGPGKERKYGSVIDFLLDLPYFPLSPAPTLATLNELFARGVLDTGMSGGCEWKPFQITADEYAEVLEELLTDPRVGH